MTFLGILGAPRKGKTILATMIAVQLYRQNKLNNKPFYLFANYHFLDEMKPVVTYVDNPRTYLTVKTPELGQGLAIWDELWTWLASRGSGTSEVNKFIQQVVFQSGKRGFDTMWIAQMSSSVDKIIRRQTFKFFKTREPTDEYFRYNYVSSTYYDGKKVMPLRIAKSVASQYYKYYDTREIIKTLTMEDINATPEPEQIILQTGTAEIEEHLDLQSEKEINQIEEELAQTHTQQTQEEYQEQKKISELTSEPTKRTIYMDLGLNNS